MMNNSGQLSEDFEEQNTQDHENDQFPDDRDDSKDDKHKEGELLTFVRVRFPGNARSFPFIVGKRKFNYGQKVLAMSDRGMTVGYINSFPYQRSYNQNMRPVRSIAKTASQEDILEQQEYNKEVRKAEVICINLIDKLKLDMTLTHVEIIHFGKKAVFYFMAPERVDFRELVKSLVGDLKMRIELRQISLRDRTAALGGIGVCGLQTCCSSFLQNYGNVSIKMAKNQNLALIPSKVNGICGQLKCCIRYEDEVYTEKRSKLPREGELIKTFSGDFGKVTRLHLIIEEFEMLTSEGQRRQYVAKQYNEKADLVGLKYPDVFENIVNETSKVIGPPEMEKKIEDKVTDDFEEQDIELQDFENDNNEGPADDIENEEEADLPQIEETEVAPFETSPLTANTQDSFQKEKEEQPFDTQEEKDRKKNKFDKKQKRFQNNPQKRK